MPPRWPVAVALVALLSGCQFAPPAPDLTAAPVTPATSAPARLPESTRLPSEDQVKAMLLGVADLPDGYVATPPGVSPAAGMGTSLQDCGSAGSSPAPGTPHVDGAAVFQRGMTTFAAEGIRISDEASAHRSIQGLATVTRDCAAFSGAAGPGLNVSVTLSQLTFPQIGDESAAFRLTGSLSGVAAAIFAHVVAFRYRDVLVVVTLMGMEEPDVASTEAVVRAAVAKVRAHR